MKITVDQNKCASSGQCVMTAPDVFDQREEDGVVTLLQESPPADRTAAVRLAVTQCPAQAIAIEEWGARAGTESGLGGRLIR